MPPPATIPQRIALLETLLAGEAAMLDELARTAGIEPPRRLAHDPPAMFGRVAAFVDGADLDAATGDARTWLLNRLGLYLARWCMARHGGTLAVQCDPAQRFYGQFVVTGMAAPVAANARLAPFAIAADAIHARPRIGLAALAGAAESALTAPAAPTRPAK